MTIYRDKRNYIRDKKNEHRNLTYNCEQSLKTSYENKVRQEQKYGKYYDLLVQGEQDRINGNAPQTFENESMLKSYNYGYFERGSRVLAGKFIREEYTPEQQKQIAIADVINGVPLKELYNLMDFPHYINGRNYQLGRNAHKYIVSNNISFEEYVYIMEVIAPEVKTEAFKEGFYSLENQKKGR